MSLYSVSAVLILDSEGKRLFAKYYAPPHENTQALTLAEQTKFEKGLFDKTGRKNNDLLIYENKLVAYKGLDGPKIYLIGPQDENEIMLFQAMMGIRDAIDSLVESTDRDGLLAQYDRVVLAIDEAIDGGIIVETEFTVIANRVTKRASEEASLQNMDFSERGIRSMFGFARDKISQAVRQQLT